tara:strand:+ start:172 stop:732 length:561 start_codon:yes stop_codon:yes gene_type:complete
MATDPNKWNRIGGITSIAGTVQGIAANYYGAETEKFKYKSMALSYQHKKDMAKINSRMLDTQVRQVGKAMNRQIMIKTMAAGQRRGRATASAAARGGSLGYGSTANLFASDEIMKEIDKITMNTNKVQAMNEARMRKVNMDIRGTMLGVSQAGALANASTVSPFLNMSSTLLTGIGDIAKNKYFEG